MEKLQSRTWWQPAFLDVVLAALLLWLFVMGTKGWGLLLSDGDTGWHIRTGEWILDHGAVPYRDLFSFSKAGAPWFAWEWLADVVFALLHRAGGLALLAFFAGVVLLGTAVLLFRHMIWKGVGPVVAFPVFLLSVGGSTMHYLARPHIFSLLFLMAAIWLLDAERQRSSRAIWWLVPLVLVWTNLHGAWPALFVLLGAQVGARLLAGDGIWKKEAIVLGVCAVATLVNPYGFGLHQHIWEYLGSDWIRERVEEFKSPQFRSENLLQFEVLLLGGLAAAGARVLRGWTGWVEGGLVFVWAHLALGSVRHAPIFILFAAPVLAGELHRVLAEGWGTAKKSSLAGVFRELDRDLRPKFQFVSLWGVILCGLVWGMSQGSWPRDFPAATFPVEARLRVGKDLAGKRIFMPDQWADYWLYHFWPETAAFIDGRSDFYGRDLGEESLKVASAEPGWERRLERWGITHAIVPEGSAIAAALRRGGWQVLHTDGLALVAAKPAEGQGERTAGSGKSPRETNGSPSRDRINRGEGPMAKVADNSRGTQ